MFAAVLGLLKWGVWRTRASAAVRLSRNEVGHTKWLPMPASEGHDMIRVVVNEESVMIGKSASMLIRSMRGQVVRN